MAIYKDDGHFFDAETKFVGCKFQFNLKSIAFESNFVEVDGFKYATFVAFEARCGVVYRDASDAAHIFRGKIAHQHASHRPVHHIHTRNVAATDGQIIAFHSTSIVKAWQVFGVVTKVSIHLKHIIITVFECPFKSSDVGCAKTEFALTFHQMNATLQVTLHQVLHDCGSSIRTSIVDDQNVKPMFFQPRYGTENGFNIFFFVVGGNDYNGIVLVHSRY